MAALFFVLEKRLDLLWLLPLILVLAVIAGVYQKLNKVSLSFIVIPGLIGFESLLPASVEDLLIILIASSLAANLPFSVMSFVSAARSFKGDFSLVSKYATRISLSSILIAQILGVIPSIYTYYLYSLFLALFASFLIIGPFLDRTDFFKSRTIDSLVYMSLFSLPLGGSGHEWGKVFYSKANAMSVGYFSTLGVFVVFPALLGFVFPALPVSFVESNPWTESWMIGYICWPISVLVFAAAYATNFLIKNTQNQTDQAWLKYILALFLLAVLFRSVMT